MSAIRGWRIDRGAAWRGALLAAMVLAPAGAAAAQGVTDAPTADEVQKAVDDYLSDDDAAQSAARAHLKQWGDAALPHMRTMAGESSGAASVGLIPLNPFSMLDDMHLVFAIDDIGTSAAIDLLLEIADGKTGLNSWLALEQLETGADWKYKDRLKGDAHFKALVLRSTLQRGPMTSLVRSGAADTIAALEWTDAAEVVEAMTRDSDLSVRESAAKAFFKLTGETVEIERPPLRFPGRRDGPPPLAQLPDPDIAQARRLRAHFGFWRDGQEGLLASDGKTLKLVGPDGQVAESWDVPDVSAVLSFHTPTGEGRWVVGTSTSEYSNEDREVVASDFEGEPLWRFERDGSYGSLSMAVLYDERGACGVALAGGDQGLHALDDQGREIFRRWGKGSERLATHRGLPGRLLVSSGDMQLLDAKGQPTTMNKMGMSFTPRGPMFLSDDAYLFPDAQGSAAIVAAGNWIDFLPVIVRLDAELAEVWRASVPADIGGLVMLEREGTPRLFVAACETGELYVFDENGAAFEPIRWAPPLEPDDHLFVDHMDAGPFDDGSWGVAIAMIGRTVLFRLE
jgi:hypothetical protein